MFNQIIRMNDLTDELANTFFENKIEGTSNGGAVVLCGEYDYSLLTSCRAIVYPRMKENDVLWVSSKYQDYFDYNIAHYLLQAKQTVTSKNDNNLKNNSYIRVMCCRESFFDDAVNVDLKDPQLHLDGWEEVEKIRLFFARNFKCVAYINKEYRCCVIVCGFKNNSEARMRYYHAVQCALLTAMPWYFDPKEEKLPELDMSLIKAIADGDSDKYLEIVKEICSRMDFKNAAIANLLDGFETQIEMRKLDDLKARVRELDNYIDGAMRDLANWSRQKQESMWTLSGLQSGILAKEGSHVLRDLFSEYQGLRFIKSESGGSRIIFAVDKYLDNWIEVDKDNALHNRRSIVYTPLRDDEAKKDEIEKLFTEIFDTKRIKMKMTGIFIMSANGGLDAGQHMSEYVPADYIPNPHIEEFRCIAGFIPDIGDALQRHDFSFAIEIAMSSAGNINFVDSTVMNFFIRQLTSTYLNRKCYELPDGRSVTYKEAIQWIDEQKSNGEEK